MMPLVFITYQPVLSSNFHFYLVQPSLTSASTFQCEICISGNVSLSLSFSAYVCLCSAVWQEVSGTGC